MFEQMSTIHPLLPPAVGLAALLAAAAVINLIVKHVVIRLVRAFARRSSTTWDDALVTHKVFGRLVQVVPALIIFVGTPLVPDLSDGGVQLIRNVAMGYMVLMLTLSLTAMLSAANTIYETLPVAKERPLKGFVQLVQIVIWVFGGVMIISAVLDRSPLLLLSGLGAMTAILLLVFKDTILSLVASVQLTAQDMVRVGDWIEMPQFGADGDVVDVQLHTVKVQNWDKTITTIPTHRLITDSFKNWRGMSESGTRRIKRSIYIDVSTIRMQTDDEVDHFTRFALLKDYIKNKEQELTDYNAGLDDRGGCTGQQTAADECRHLSGVRVQLPQESPEDRQGRDADRSSARSGARRTAVGNLLLHEHNRMGRLRRHPVGYIRSPDGHRAGIRVASVSKTGRFRSGESQIEHL